MKVYVVRYKGWTLKSDIRCIFATFELANEYISSKDKPYEYEVEVYKVLDKLP